MKNYMSEVPETDQEVEECIRQMHGNTLTTENMMGVYRIQRAKGKDILTAYETTLRAYLEASGALPGGD